MSPDNIKQWYKQLTPTGQTVVVIAGTGVVLFIGYSVWKAVKDVKQTSESLKEARESVTTLTQLDRLGIKPTFTNAQFESFSNQLAQSFSGCGTDNNTIYNIISSLSNEADLYKLIAVYGVRSYGGCKWLFEGTQNKSLSAAISDELSATEKDRINGSLAVKGINFKFA